MKPLSFHDSWHGPGQVWHEVMTPSMVPGVICRRSTDFYLCLCLLLLPNQFVLANGTECHRAAYMKGYVMSCYVSATRPGREPDPTTLPVQWQWFQFGFQFEFQRLRLNRLESGLVGLDMPRWTTVTLELKLYSVCNRTPRHHAGIRRTCCVKCCFAFSFQMKTLYGQCTQVESSFCSIQIWFRCYFLGGRW